MCVCAEVCSCAEMCGVLVCAWCAVHVTVVCILLCVCVCVCGVCGHQVKM